MLPKTEIETTVETAHAVKMKVVYFTFVWLTLFFYQSFCIGTICSVSLLHVFPEYALMTLV